MSALADEKQRLEGVITSLQAMPPNAPLDDFWQKAVPTMFMQWHDLYEFMGLSHAVNTTNLVVYRDHETKLPTLIRGHETVGQVLNRAKQVKENFHQDLLNRCCETIDAGKEKIYGRSIGDQALEEKFPSAVDEMREANTSFALNRNTACVFHAMRTVEYGMRALLDALGGTTAPHLPLEHQQWNGVIEQIEKRYKDLAVPQWNQPAKANALAFFSVTISDLHAFKEAVRNVCMHTRTGGVYDEPGADSIRKRVLEFFKRLGTRIEEARTAPLTEKDFS